VLPFFSRSGRWVGFYGDGKIKKVSVDGGYPRDLADCDPDSPGAAWGYDGRVYFSQGYADSGIVAVPEDGGVIVPVSTLDKSSGERGHWYPEPLADGRHVLFTIWYAAGGLEDSKVAVLDLQTGHHRVLFPGALARYGAGYLIYFRSGVYQIVPFDAQSLTATGEPQPVLPDAQGLSPQGSNEHLVSISLTGNVAYLPGELYPEVEIAWLEADGRHTPTPATIRADRQADVSRDGHRLAAATPQGGSLGIVIVDLKTGAQQRLPAAAMNWSPFWHPDGRRVGHSSMRKGDFDVFIQRVDGGSEEPVEISTDDVGMAGWMPDGRVMARDWKPDGSTSVFLLDRAGARQTLVTGPFEKGEPTLSADGRRLALFANRGGGWQVYAQSIDGRSGLQQVSAREANEDGGLRWSPSGDALYFVRGTALMRAAIDVQGGRMVGEESIVGTVPRNTAIAGVGADGRRVLIMKPVARASTIPPGVRIIIDGLASLVRGGV
jgi:Tol biopolymer transport system component